MAITTAMIMIIIMAMKTMTAAAAAATRWLSAIFRFVLYSAATGRQAKKTKEGEGGVSGERGRRSSATKLYLKRTSTYIEITALSLFLLVMGTRDLAHTHTHYSHYLCAVFCAISLRKQQEAEAAAASL